jgi:hypothetical protein
LKLEDGHSLFDYNVKNNATILVSLKVATSSDEKEELCEAVEEQPWFSCLKPGDSVFALNLSQKAYRHAQVQEPGCAEDSKCTVKVSLISFHVV